MSNLPQLVQAGSQVSKSDRYHMKKNVKFAGKAGPTDQEAAEEFLKISAKHYTWKGLYGRAGFNADETSLFYKNVGKWTYAMQMASKAPGFKSCKDCATLLLHANIKSDSRCKPMVHRAQNPIALRGEKPEPYASPLEVEQNSMDGVRNILGLVPQLLHPRSQILSPQQKLCLQGFVNFG